MFKNENKLAKGHTMHGALLAIVLLYDPSFCFNTCIAASTRVLEISNCAVCLVFSPVDSMPLLSPSPVIFNARRIQVL